MEKIDFETVLVESSKLPMVKIDRELFLRKELKGRYNPEVVEKAIRYSPAYAGISVEEINRIAKSCITAETTRGTAISAVAGIPGGFALIGTVPADFTQYFAHILRIVQELIYLYGWKELNLDSTEMNQETKNLLILFVGIMFGVKRVAALVGVRMTKQIFSKGVAKVVPFVGAAISGGVTFITYNLMAEKLREYLASNELASVEHYKQMVDEAIIDVEIIEDAESVTE